MSEGRPPSVGRGTCGNSLRTWYSPRIRGTKQQGVLNGIKFGGPISTGMGNGQRNGLFLVCPLLPVISA